MGAPYNDSAKRWGRKLRQQRRRVSGMTQKQLARAIGVHETHVSNLETGMREPTPEVLRGLEKALTTDGQLTRLWETLTESDEPAWISALSDLERQATTVLECQTTVFPSLIQTEEYARAITRGSSPWASTEEVENAVAQRMRRVDWFKESRTPYSWVILDEPIIRRHVGAVAALRQQLCQTVELIESGRVNLQILPFMASSHTGMPSPFLTAPFKVLSSLDAPDVVYAESIHSGHFVDDPVAVAEYRILYGALQAGALSVNDSIELVYHALESLKNE